MAYILGDFVLTGNTHKFLKKMYAISKGADPERTGGDRRWLTSVGKEKHKIVLAKMVENPTKILKNYRKLSNIWENTIFKLENPGGILDIP